jgi:CDK inhibitor PHO81
MQLESGLGIDTASELRQDSIMDSDDVADDKYREIETQLRQAIADENRAAVLDLISNLPDTPSASRIFWLAALEAPAGIATEPVIPYERLDFSFIDDINSRTPLHEAASYGHTSLVSTAAQHGVSIVARDVYGREALHYAAMNGHQDVCTLLLKLGADASAVDMDGHTPVTYAMTNGRIGCVETFLEANAAQAIRRQPQQSGLDPLTLACQFGHADIVRLLLAHGAVVEPDDAGYYPQHLAAREGHADVLKLLVAAGAQVDVPDKYSTWTPLFHAASEGNTDCVRVLLDAGCDDAAKDEFGKTSVHYAAWQGYIDCVNLLLERGGGPDVFLDSFGAGRQGYRSPGKDHAVISTASSGEPGPVADLDIEMDGIPALSLPPPILPTRLYGHNYLDRHSMAHLSLGHPATSHQPAVPPVRLYGQSQLSSLKLVVSTRPVSFAVPHNIILPLSDEREVFPFKVESFDTVSLEFDLSPTFGSKVLGKAVALPSMFSELKDQGHYVIPLVDAHLRVIGEIAFELSVVRAFEGVQLEIGGRVETYWKSTNTSLNRALTLESAPLTATTTPAAVVTASSLSGEHVRIVVQVTADGVPVAYPHWTLPVDGFDVHVGDVTLDQFVDLARRKGLMLEGGAAHELQARSDPTLWHEAIQNSLVPLCNLLQVRALSLIPIPG